jgi:hypothetical protein
MIRFDVPQAEWREILSQLKRDTTLHTLEQGDQLEDRIAANHGIAWWCPERMRDLTWCIKNNGRLFIAGGTVNDRDDVTVFVKFYDVGF